MRRRTLIPLAAFVLAYLMWSGELNCLTGLGRLVVQGRFHRVAHLGSGRAGIYRQQDGTYVLRVTNLEIPYRPDLVVYLNQASDADDNASIRAGRFVVAGELKAKREQSFALPRAVDVARYHSVTIWSTRYGVNFATAPLR